jgi:acyl-CoA synthetase (AMP-forming)/AMP-acid ligase II
VRVLQGYGLTETTNFATTMPRDVSAQLSRRLCDETGVPSIGTALFGNEVAVLTPAGDLAAAGKQGEICMRGHNVMTRYVGNPAATASAFRHGWFHSGDLGLAIEDAESDRVFFAITGRLKNIAKVRGESVSLDEMDRVLRAVPGVVDAVSVAIPHRLLGDEVVAAVVVCDGAQGIDLRGQLARVFARDALPRRIVALDALPRTPTGKIRRPELLARLTGGADGQ